MGSLLSTVGIILVSIIVIVSLASMIVLFKYLTWFHLRSCKHCGHNMEYKGLKEDNEDGHYLFHCEHCGAWEQIPRDEFIHSCDADCNPNSV